MTSLFKICIFKHYFIRDVWNLATKYDKLIFILIKGNIRPSSERIDFTSEQGAETSERTAQTSEHIGSTSEPATQTSLQIDAALEKTKTSYQIIQT